MDLIQSALRSPDLGDGFTYPEHVLKLCRKFSRGTQSNIRQNILAQINLFRLRHYLNYRSLRRDTPPQNGGFGGGYRALDFHQFSSKSFEKKMSNS